MRGKATVATIALAASMLVGSSASAAEFDFIVSAGAVHPTAGVDAGYEFTRYYPEHLRIHRNQEVRWTMPGESFHSITFMPEGEPRPPLTRGEEIPGTLAFSQPWVEVSACGHAGQPACVLTDTQTFVSSGPPPSAAPFDVVFDLPVGTYSYLCIVHATMSGVVEVVDDSETLAAREDIAAQVLLDVQADAAEADAYVAAHSVPQSTIEDGVRVWTVEVGPSIPSDHVSVLGFLPASLSIVAGDAVRWAIPDGVVNEIHTVSFPSLGASVDTAVEIASFSMIACDLDGIQSGVPGIPGVWSATTCPGDLEALVAPWFTNEYRAPGNAVAGRSPHQSGLLVPADAPEGFRGRPPGSGDYFPSSFDAAFPAPVAAPYYCIVHNYANMTGSVVVT